ncbi:hypothetical protein BEN48_15270 [Hymenobacter glacialis]|uniref:Uncharacterized protein n=1 Tax=Hymenobacter glacialis TaxID=1908236 RepID=A0A1G1T292_9BACT|nr:hypothetical protein BEN48_15270 [Hymenobacter glacialis]
MRPRNSLDGYGKIVGRLHQHLILFHNGKHGIGNPKQPSRGSYYFIQHFFAARIQQLVPFKGMQAGGVVGRN